MAITITEIETAIQSIQNGGQAVTVDGFSYSKANLDALIRLRDSINSDTQRSSGARPPFRGFQFTNMGYSA